MKQKKRSPFLFFTTAILILALCGISLFLLPQRSYSEHENRYLTTFQKPSVRGFFDSSMQQNLTKGANDQFPGRDGWMKFATSLKRMTGMQDMGGVLFGKDGYYFERILDSDLSMTRYRNNLRYLKQAATNLNIKTFFLPVPSKGTILTHLLPEHAVLYDADSLYKMAEETLSAATLIDIRSTLSDAVKDQQLYFKTDHHWTMHASYLAYTSWCRRHSYTPAPLSGFAPECVSEDFFGTLYSKAPCFDTQPDRLELPVHVPKASIFIQDKPVESIYDWNRLDTKDKYGVYFGGNTGRIDIHTRHRKGRGTLLIIKDSFANSLVPFLMTDYDHITMIDFRYYNLPFSRLVQEILPDETLVLYEMGNFAQDENFFKILK